VKPSYPGDAKALGTRPLAFTENKGQFDKQVKFQVSGSGGTLWLTDSGIVFDSLRAKSSQNSQLRTEPQPTRLTPRNQNVAEHPQIEDRALRDMERHIIFQDFVGASHNLSIETKGLQQGTYNYLSGSDPSKWQHSFADSQKLCIAMFGTGSTSGCAEMGQTWNKSSSWHRERI